MEENEVIDGSIQDERTQEIIPMPAPQAIAKTDSNLVSFEIVEYDKVGTLVVDDKAAKVLAEPLLETDIRIRPDGNIYVPWTWYADRLNRAFGIANWGLIPQGMPLSKPMGSAVLVVWGHWLIVRGIPIGFAMGETTYFPSNNMMSYADACEGAKSNSLARNCKLLGMTLDLWDSEFGHEWKQKFATKTKDDKGKDKWIKKPVGPVVNQPIQPVTTSPSLIIPPVQNVTPPPPEEPPAEPSIQIPEPVVPSSTVPTASQLPGATKHPEIARVKADWVNAAVAKGILKDTKDSIGAKRLIAVLGVSYSTLNSANAESNRADGLKAIANWLPS